LRYAGPDPRIALRQRQHFLKAEEEELLSTIDRLGAKSAGGRWGLRTLRLIAAHPQTRAARLAEMAGIETLRFKTRVRQLKDLGLTESLDVGYRLSPRGQALLRAVAGDRDA
jgi:hypothetical protein